MAAKGGKTFLLKIGDGAGSEVFTTLGGLRAKSLSINAEAIDVTSHDDSEWKKLLDTSGIKSMSLSGSGIFTDHSTFNRARTVCMANTICNFEIVESDSGEKYSGAFKITSMELTGDYNAEMSYSMSMESSGAITYA